MQNPSLHSQRGRSRCITASEHRQHVDVCAVHDWLEQVKPNATILGSIQAATEQGDLQVAV